MNEIESCDVDFLKEDFPSIGDVKKDIELYELEDLLGDTSLSHRHDEDYDFIEELSETVGAILYLVGVHH